MSLDEAMKSHVPNRQGHDFRYAVNLRKIESPGFERKIDFVNGLKATIDWYSN